ncbi:MAG: hypothetical protein E7661_02165 [Ruminococcaceae bacterium]|nr:hypothetical protein [Oscillospiraceae bacterium]
MSAKRPNGKHPLRPLWQRLYAFIKRFSRLPEEESIEPIDFSAPSVPYYTNLAERFNLARIVLYMVLFVFVVVTVVSSRHLITYENLYYLVKDVGAATLTAQSQADHLNYPVSGVSADFGLYRGGLTIAGSEEITVLSGSGKQTLSENVSLAAPQIRTGEQYFVTFSRGERDFSVYNAFVRVKKEATEFPVYDVCMGRDGAYAVLTRSADYTSEVIFYDADMTKRLAVRRIGYVTAMSVSPDGSTLAVVSLELGDNGYTTKVSFVRSDGTEKQVLLSDTTALSAEFLSDDRLAVVFEDRIVFYRNDSVKLSEIPYEGDTPLLTAATTDGYVGLLMASREQLDERVLKVYDKNGKATYEVALEDVDDASELVLHGKNVYIRLKTHILYVSEQGAKQAVASVPRDTVSLLPDSNGSLLACGPAYAVRIKPSDFRVKS